MFKLIGAFIDSLMQVLGMFNRSVTLASDWLGVAEEESAAAIEEIRRERVARLKLTENE